MEELIMYQLPIRAFDINADYQRVKNFFAQMGGESRAFFNRGNGNEKTALRFFDKSAAEKNSQYAFFMALDGEEMAGYVFLWDIQKSVVWLGIAVAENWKGKHLGRDLMKHAEDYAKSLNKGGILLTTNFANIRGQTLYTNCGYEHLGTHTCGELLYLKRF